MEQSIARQVESVAKRMEEQLDGELDRLNNLEIDDIAAIRQKRLLEMKKKAQQQMDWKHNGHGEYAQIPDQKEFFDVCKGSERVVVHFFRKSSHRCDIFDMHLKILASKHIETRFCKIDAEKSPFLCERINITVLPTVLLLKDAITIGRLTGFSDLDNKDDFSTDLLEWVMAQYDMIEYHGDKDVRPTGKKQKPPKNILKSFSKRKNIRGKNDDGNGSDRDSD